MSFKLFINFYERILIKYLRIKGTFNQKNMSNIGGLNFDAQDRLAILNLLNGITIFYDNYDGGLKDYINCYSENGVFILKIPGQDPQYAYKNPPPGQQSMEIFFGTRIASFIKNGIQNRHNFSNTVVYDQTKETALCKCNLIFVKNQEFTGKDGSPNIPLTVLMSAQYDITVVKVDNIWKVKEMVANVDNLFS